MRGKKLSLLTGSIVLQTRPTRLRTRYDCAADKANAIEDEAEVAWRWRNWQLLHLHYMAKREARRKGKAFNLHLSCYSLDSYFRGKDNLTSDMMGEVMRQVFEKGGTVTTVSNFPAFEKSLKLFFPGQVEVLHRVPYEELNLRINGEMVFPSLNRLGNITYLSINPPDGTMKC